MTETETRTIDVDVEDLDTRGNTVCGYASVYDVLSHDLGGFRERVQRGAFADVLDADVRCVLNHDPSQVLGRTRAGTLRLADDERGLRFECDLPRSPLGANVREAVSRGDIDGASFRFKVAPDGEQWDGEVRTVTKVAELLDCSVATFGAYPAASVELRSRPDASKPAGEREKAEPMKTEDRDSGAGLAVESRTESAATSTPTVEARVTESLRSVAKGETRSLTTSSASAIAPPELSTYLFDKLRATSVALKAGIRVIPTDRSEIQWPKLTTDVSPTWYDELDTITAGDPAFTTITATPRKLAHRVELSNEVIDDSEPSVVEVLNTHLATMLALKLDLAIFEGSGTAPEIRGLKNVSGTQTVSMGTNGASLTNLDPIADAIGLLEAANATGPYAVVMNPRTFGVIRKLKDTSNQPLMTDHPTDDTPPRIFGARVYSTSQLSTTETQGTSSDASSVFVFAPKEVVLVRRQDAEIELDRSRLFNIDASELRGKLRCDLVVPNPAAVVRVVGVRP